MAQGTTSLRSGWKGLCIALTTAVERGEIGTRHKVAVLLVSTLIGSLVFADVEYEFDIPAAEADVSIKAMSRHTGTSAIFQSVDVEDIQVNPVMGRYTLEEALEVLFQGTLLSGTLTDSGVITISRNVSSTQGEDEMTNSKNKNLLAAFVGFVVGGTGVHQVTAQENTTLSGNTGTRASMEEIVVTARKREESLVDVPVSISVLSSTVIDEAGIQEPRDFFEMTPGVDFDIEHDRIGSQPAVRGVQSNNTATTRQKVTSFIDGLPMVGAAGSLGFTGVERIEVFRGPQSAAFGRATFAGAINYVTQDPGDEFEGKVELQTSEFGRNKAQIEISGPINDTLGYAISALKDAYDGPDDWVSSEGFDVGGNSTTFVSGKLKFTPNDRFSAEIMARYTLTDDDIPLRYYISAADLAECSNYTTDGGRPYIRGTFNCNTDIPDGGVQTNADAAAPFQDPAVYSDADRALAETYRIEPMSENERKRLQGEFTYSTDHGDIQLLAFVGDETYQRWFDRDRTASPLQIIPMTGTIAPGFRNVNAVTDPTKIDESMYELRWLSNGTDRLSWTVGASYYDYVFDSQLYNRYAIIADGGTSNPFLIISENSQNTAVFANLTYDLTDQTTLSLEGRYQSEDMANLNTITDEYFTNTSTAFLPRLAINHDFGNGVTAYAQVAKGVNPAGVNATAASPGIQAAHAQATNLGYISWDLEDALYFDQEEILNTEIGVKAALLDNRLQLSAALYKMDWKHYNQISTLPFDVVQLWEDNGMVGPMPTYDTGNARDYSLRAYLDLGSANVTGFEGEATYIINENWDVSGSLTLSNSEFEELCDASAVSDLRMTPTNTPGDGSGVLFDCVDVSGNEFTRQPKEAYALATTFRTGLADSQWDLLARLDYRVVGEQWLDAVNLAALPESTTLNASVTFSKENMKIQLWGRNLTNDDTPRVAEYGTSYNESPSGNPNFNILPREPSELGVTFSYEF